MGWMDLQIDADKDEKTEPNKCQSYYTYKKSMDFL